MSNTIPASPLKDTAGWNAMFALPVKVTVNQSAEAPGSFPWPVAVFPTPRVPRLVPPQLEFGSSQQLQVPPMLKHVPLQVYWQASPGPGQVPAVAFPGSGRQSALVQHVASPMHRFPQAFWPTGQLHVPPGPEQVSPVTVQPVAGQQLVVAIQALFVVQNVCPVGQLQDPPGPEQVPPPTQSASVQHSPFAMHALNGGEAMMQTEPPLGQTQLPPGPVQVSLVVRQSLLVQHVFVGMHVLFTVQTLFPVPQLQVPPGAEHVSLVTVQSALVQQAVLGMQALFPAQALEPVGHAHVPPGVAQVSPVILQSAFEQQFVDGMHVPLAAQPV